jgi:hypothetical protein
LFFPPKSTSDCTGGKTALMTNGEKSGRSRPPIPSYLVHFPTAEEKEENSDEKYVITKRKSQKNM